MENSTKTSELSFLFFPLDYEIFWRTNSGSFVDLHAICNFCKSTNSGSFVDLHAICNFCNHRFGVCVLPLLLENLLLV